MSYQPLQINNILIGGDGAVMSSSRMAIVAAAANLEHDQANGYNSGDEYTGRTGNNLTLTEWQEVLIKSFFYFKKFYS